MRRSPLRRGLAVILAALLAAVVSAAAVQASETTETPVAAATHAAIRAAQKAERQAQKIGEQEARRAQRQARIEAQRAAQRKAREAIRLAKKEKEGNSVAIGCSGVTVNYNGFPSIAGSPNVVSEWISIKNPPESLSSGPIAFPPITYSFEGPSSTQVVPIAFPVGHYLVDVHAKWATNGARGNFDIHGNVTCTPAPNFSLQKLETIAGSGKPSVGGPLTALVGQTVDYTIIATNTGNTPLTFTMPIDAHCDPGTLVLASGSLGPIEPLGTVTYTCTHKLTAADQTAGSYTNVASVTGEPEQGEGPGKTKESNTVVVTPITSPPDEKGKEEPNKEEEHKTEEPKTEPKHEEKPPTTTTLGTGTTTPTGGVLGGGLTSKSGVLGFASATIPSLRGPQGCVRGPFVASIKAPGVSSVVFYLDGHKLRTLTAKNARKGLLSVRIDASKLHIGVHHLLARITMKKASAAAKAAKAARSLTIVRCASSVVTPHFTA